MANTRITRGVIKPNENYDTHNIKSTGIITAIGLDISGNASIGGVLTYEDVTSIDPVGIITARAGVVSPNADIDDFISVGSNIHLGNAGVITATAADIDDFLDVGSNIKLGNAGVITATSIVGDGSDLTNLPAGLGTALSATASSPLNKMYYTNQVLGVPSSITVDVPASSSKAYTQYADIKVESSADLIVAEGDDLIPDILGLADFGTFGGGASAGRIRVNSISNASNDGAPTVQKGLIITGVTTTTTLNVTGNATIAGTLTYEDVKNIDSVGIITARSGVDVDDFISVGSNIHLGNAGVVTATSFVGSGAQLTGIVGGKFGGGATGIQTVGNVGVQTADMTSANLVGAASSLVGLYIGDGSLLFSNNLSRSGGYYITTGLNALNAGPVTLGSTMTLDGAWVIV